MSDTKIIYTLNTKGNLNELVFNEDYCAITVGNKEIYITTEHEQDCCEHVYCDFEQGDIYKEQVLNTWVDSFQIKAVPNLGIMLCFGDIPTLKILLPCYNCQNGYYSSDLDLKIKTRDSKLGLIDFTTIDITDYVKDEID